MELYNNNNGLLEQVKDIGFKLEKDMQSLTEKNLKEILGLDFISSEFQLNNLRIDTLAFDVENNAFVIIEFKRGSSYSVIDQGFSYLSLMLNNKADFILLLQESKKKTLKKEDIDWSQTRVIFIADSFTRYQQESINFKDLPIELIEIKQFSNGNIVYNKIKASNTSESIKTITKADSTLNKVEKEIKTYTLEDLIKNISTENKELFEELRTKIFENIDSDLSEKANRDYYVFQKGRYNIVALHFRINKIVIHIPRVLNTELNDYKKITRNIPEERGWGRVVEFDISSKDEILYAIQLISQAYDKYHKS